MSEMIEKVARAINTAAWGVHNVLGEREGQYNHASRQMSLVHARAALTAILEPSDDMVMKGVYYDAFAGLWSDTVAAVEVKGMYKSMIQAALEEPTSETDQLGGVGV